MVARTEQRFESRATRNQPAESGPARPRKEAQLADDPAHSSDAKSAAMPLVIGLAIGLFVVLMMLSINLDLIDDWAIGTWHGYLGVDFFSVPRSFLNLQNGVSPYDTMANDYGPPATWFPYHPAVALLVGSWTSQMRPDVAYRAFILVSLAMLLLSISTITSQLKSIRHQALAMAPLFISIPTYLLLWNAQMHVFTVVAAALILGGLLQLLRQSSDPTATPVAAPLASLFSRNNVLISIGLLASLLTKPLLLLIVPLLVLVKETRLAAVASIVIYALISAAFLLIPALNPKGDNSIHWTNIVRTAGSQSAYIASGETEASPMSHNREIYSLPSMLDHLVPGLGSSPLTKLPLVVIVITSILAALASSSALRISLALLVVVISLAAYYLAYPCVWEYHYTTVLPIAGVLLVLWQTTIHKTDRLLLAIAALSVFALMIPVPAPLVSDAPAKALVFLRVFRVIPMCVLFTAATSLFAVQWRSGRTLSASGLQAPASFALQLPTWQLAAASFVMATLALSMGGDRLSAMVDEQPSAIKRLAVYDRLMQRDPTNHSHCAAAAKILTKLRRYEEATVLVERYVAAAPSRDVGLFEMANMLLPEEQAIAMRMLEEVVLINPNHAGANNNLAALLLPIDPERAVECVERATKSEPSNPDFHYNLGMMRAGLHDWAGAIEAFEAAIAINPTIANGQDNLEYSRTKLQQQQAKTTDEASPANQ